LSVDSAADQDPGREGERADVEDVKGYLDALMSRLRAGARAGSDPAGQEPIAADRVPQAVLDLLTGREYCYLSKSRVAAYRESILGIVGEAARRGGPIPFYLDLGGGYHASTRPGDEGLCFEVGLGELFVLSQIASFAGRVRRVYPPGVAFSLVIDNVCALVVNDVPLARTGAYCEDLRRLIRDVGTDGLVDVLVESEHFSIHDFDLPARKSDPCAVSLTPGQRDNVERFLGRPCDEAEAVERFLRYQEVIDISDRLLATLIAGVRMTQRATPETLCFRAFPGGDSRIQSGEIALARNDQRRLYPLLLSSRNIGDYACRRLRFPGLLPVVISYVTYAERASG